MDREEALSQEEEEEELLLVELTGLPNPELIKQSHTCSVLGVDTDKPVIQVGSFVFRGDMEEMLGTGLVFEQADIATHSTKATHTSSLSNSKLNYVGKVHRKMNMTRVVLKKKRQTHKPETTPTNTA